MRASLRAPGIEPDIAQCPKAPQDRANPVQPHGAAWPFRPILERTDLPTAERVNAPLAWRHRPKEPKIGRLMIAEMPISTRAAMRY